MPNRPNRDLPRETQHNIIAAVSWAVSVACLIGIYMEILG